MQQESDQRPFITIWKTDAANETVAILLVGSDMTVHRGDGYSSADITETATHTCVNHSTYPVSVYGGLKAIQLGGHLYASMLVPVDQRGDMLL